MRKLWVGAIALLLAGCSIGEDIPAAKNAVVKFHRQLDAGQSAEIYRAASKDMHDATPEAELVQLLDAVHRKLGKFQSASDAGWNDQFTNGDHFISLTYASKYERGQASENFVYRIEGGKPSLAGYHVSSNALIVN